VHNKCPPPTTIHVTQPPTIVIRCNHHHMYMKSPHHCIPLISGENVINGGTLLRRYCLGTVYVLPRYYRVGTNGTYSIVPRIPLKKSMGSQKSGECSLKWAIKSKRDNKGNKNLKISLFESLMTSPIIPEETQFRYGAVILTVGSPPLFPQFKDIISFGMCGQSGAI